MKLVQVEWHTVETTYWSDTVEIEDDADIEDLNGDAPELVAVEDRAFEEGTYSFDEFTREIDSVLVLP